MSEAKDSLPEEILDEQPENKEPTDEITLPAV